MWWKEQVIPKGKKEKDERVGCQEKRGSMERGRWNFDFRKEKREGLRFAFFFLLRLLCVSTREGLVGHVYSWS